MQRGKKDYNHQEPLTSMMTTAHHVQAPRKNISAGHFSNVLNVNNQFNISEVERVCEREVDVTLGRVPSRREVIKAFGELKNGKAPGNSDILPEMLKVGKKNSDQVHQHATGAY